MSAGVYDLYGHGHSGYVAPIAHVVPLAHHHGYDHHDHHDYYVSQYSITFLFVLIKKTKF